MSDSTFMNLTTKQHRVFEQIAIGREDGHHYGTVKALLRKGLIERVNQPFLSKSGNYYYYKVPLSIHIAWREWCSQVQDES